MVGYNAKLSGLKLTPYLIAKHSYVSFDGYIEEGSSAPLIVGSNDFRSLESVLGFEVAYPFMYKGVKYVPKTSVGWQHDFINDDIVSKAAFAAQPSTSFSSTSNASGADLLNLGVGIDIFAVDNIDISLDYNLDLKKEFKAHSASLNAKFNL
jgi:outer membrane autotransporter protein